MTSFLSLHCNHTLLQEVIASVWKEWSFSSKAWLFSFYILHVLGILTYEDYVHSNTMQCFIIFFFQFQRMNNFPIKQTLRALIAKLVKKK